MKLINRSKLLRNIHQFQSNEDQIWKGDGYEETNGGELTLEVGTEGFLFFEMGNSTLSELRKWLKRKKMEPDTLGSTPKKENILLIAKGFKELKRKA